MNTTLRNIHPRAPGVDILSANFVLGFRSKIWFTQGWRAALTSVSLVFPACNSGPDYTPIGAVMKAIGVCLVVFGVVQALAELIRDEKSTTKTREKKSGKKGGGV